MKNTIKTMLGLSLLALAPCTLTAQEATAPAAPAEAAAPSPEAIKEVFSYFMGYQYGQQISVESSALKADDIDPAVFFRALADGMTNKVAPDMREKDLRLHMDAFMNILEERGKQMSAANLAKGKEFLAENAKKDGVVTTESGLQYKVLSGADGRKFDEKKDGKNANCSVTYEGRLIDGTVFDAAEEPVEFPINGVVPGFSEALKAMPIGSEWEVYIPSDLGYGEQGPGVIGNNATLIFKLKLHDITPGRGTSQNPIELTPEIMQQLQEQGLVPLGEENEEMDAE